MASIGSCSSSKKVNEPLERFETSQQDKDRTESHILIEIDEDDTDDTSSCQCCCAMTIFKQRLKLYFYKKSRESIRLNRYVVI